MPQPRPATCLLLLNCRWPACSAQDQVKSRTQLWMRKLQLQLQLQLRWRRRSRAPAGGPLAATLRREGKESETPRMRPIERNPQRDTPTCDKLRHTSLASHDDEERIHRQYCRQGHDWTGAATASRPGLGSQGTDCNMGQEHSRGRSQWAGASGHAVSLVRHGRAWRRSDGNR